MSVKNNKSRTSITIDPVLWGRVRMYCNSQFRSNGKPLSFSEVVERALTQLLAQEES